MHDRMQPHSAPQPCQPYVGIASSLLQKAVSPELLLSAHEVGRGAGRLAARVCRFVGIDAWRQSGVDHMLYIVSLFRNGIVTIRCRARWIAGLVLHGASKTCSIVMSGYRSVPANAA
jgi:hypothetical protein